jgi:putative MFS transporter
MTVVFGTLFALQNNPVMLVICGFMITWSNAWLTISYHAYQAEVFPTHIRARAVGFCYSFSRLSTAVTSILIGIILQYAGTPGVISFIVASMLMVMLSVGISARKPAVSSWRISDCPLRRRVTAAQSAHGGQSSAH